MTFKVIDNSVIDQSSPGLIRVVNALRINGVNYDVEIVGDGLPLLKDDPLLASRVKAVWAQFSQAIPTNNLESVQVDYNRDETSIQFRSLQGRVEHLNGLDVEFNLGEFEHDAFVGDSFNERYAPSGRLDAHGAVSYLFAHALRPHYVSLPSNSSAGPIVSPQPQFNGFHPGSSTVVDLSSTPPSGRSSMSASPARRSQPQKFTFSPASSPRAPLRGGAKDSATVELMDDSAANSPAVSPKRAATATPIPRGAQTHSLDVSPLARPSHAFRSTFANPSGAVVEEVDSPSPLSKRAVRPVRAPSPKPATSGTFALPNTLAEAFKQLVFLRIEEKRLQQAREERARLAGT